MKIVKQPKVDYIDGKIVINDKESNTLGTVLDLIVSTDEETGVENHLFIIARLTEGDKLQLVIQFPSGIEQVLATEV